MPSDPKAIPDVLHVDGPTRDAMLAVIEREAGYDAEWIVKILRDEFPVSAEPSPPESDTRCDTAAGRAAITPEPSLDALREALENVERAAREVDEHFRGDAAEWTFDEAALEIPAATALLSLHDYLNDAQNAREALATDQSQSDRTSDEAE